MDNEKPQPTTEQVQVLSHLTEKALLTSALLPIAFSTGFVVIPRDSCAFAAAAALDSAVLMG